MEPLLSPGFLFRVAVPCAQRATIWTPSGSALDEGCELPAFSALNGRTPRVPVRVGWNASGLAIAIRVAGKRMPPWCRETRIEDSDGLQIWIDTRPTWNIHRAGRFCHRLAFLPTGAGRSLNEPFAGMLAIDRARESPREFDQRTLKVVARLRADGYDLEAFVPAGALTGFDPKEHPRLGFAYMVLDRELGTQCWTIGSEFPVAEDPSLWGALDLVAE